MKSHRDAGTRDVMSHAKKSESSFSPDLLNMDVELAPDSLAPGGRWVACGDLLPLVPLQLVLKLGHPRVQLPQVLP